MPVKIRLMRIGAKKRPFYRVVAVDERKKRTGAYLELLGTYNPLTEPKEINLKQDRIEAWIKNGAQLSAGFLRITGKAPQRPPRKAKKELKQELTESSKDKETPKGSAPAVENVEQPADQQTGETDAVEIPAADDAPAGEPKADE